MTTLPGAKRSGRVAPEGERPRYDFVPQYLPVGRLVRLRTSRYPTKLQSDRAGVVDRVVSKRREVIEGEGFIAFLQLPRVQGPLLVTREGHEMSVWEETVRLWRSGEDDGGLDGTLTLEGRCILSLIQTRRRWSRRGEQLAIRRVAVEGERE